MLRLVLDVGVFVHTCVNEEVVGGRRGEWDVDVSGENGDGKEQRRRCLLAVMCAAQVQTYPQIQTHAHLKSCRQRAS